MSESMLPEDPFYEVQELLHAYADSGFTFTDTPDTPGAGLSSYIRVILLDRERGLEAVRQLDVLLSFGIFAEEISDEVDLFLRIEPPPGMSVDECLRLARDHIAFALDHPDQFPMVAPQNGWEWCERFPALHELLAGYFNQDFTFDYSSRDEALNTYLADMSVEQFSDVVREIPEFLSMASSEEEAWSAAEQLGLGVYPPKGSSTRQWLLHMRAVVEDRWRSQPT